MPENTNLIAYCDLDAGGGVLYYTRTLLSLGLVAPVHAILITHPPKTESGKNELLFFEKTLQVQLVFLGPYASRDITLLEIEAALTSIGSGVFFPNYREAPHAACIKAKEIGMRTFFVAHNDHPSYYRYATRYQAVLDGFICPSKKSALHLQGQLRGSSREAVHHIPHAICVEGFDANLERTRTGPIRLLYHGRIDFEQKNLLALVGIARELRQLNVSFEVHLCGDGKDLPDLQKAIEAAGLSAYFVHHGFIRHENLPDFFAQTDIAILVSSTEGFCLGLAEAMFCGLPGVAFECGGVINDYLIDGENGYIIGFNNHRAFAKAIKKLTDDPDLYRMMSGRARHKLVHEFGRDRFFRAYMDAVQHDAAPHLQKWPAWRPKLHPYSRKSKEGIVDWLGRQALGWPGGF